MPIEIEKPKRYLVKVGGVVVGKAELRRVPVNAIRIDPEYQRDLSQPWVHAHLPFNEQQAGAVVLSSRAGGPFCVDGGHRVALARASGCEQINAFVMDGLSKQQEAALFTRYQRERRNLTAHALYRADIVAMDPETLGMVTVVNRCGFQLDKKSGDFAITAIDAIRYVYRQGGPSLLAETLGLIKSEMWTGLDKALSGQILKGVALFLKSSMDSPAFRRDRLGKVMRTNAPERLLLHAQTIAIRRRSVSVGASNVAEALVDLYNKGVPEDQQLKALTIGSKRRPAPRGSA